MSEKKLTHNEELKTNCPTLAGTLAETLDDDSLDKFDKDDQQFMKFHGIYQQDDRDLRKQGKKFIFMVRGRIAGGVLAPEHYITYDNLATELANNTLRITSRQSFQFHGIVKSGLRPLIRRINEAMSSTIAACGDVNRNVMAPPTPALNGMGEQVLEHCRLVSEKLVPTTPAYHDIWIEGVKLKLSEEEAKNFEDPLYGKTYLPRKFKAAFAIPGLNDVDIFTNCLGFIAIGDGNTLEGYNLVAGGGMGMTHNNAATFPRIGDVIGFLKPDQVEAVSKAVLLVHRDFGDRTDRKHARLKYVLEEQGVEWFRAEVEKRLDFKLEPAREFKFEKQGDMFGWHEQHDGKLFLGLYVLAGRIQDTDTVKLKTAIRRIVEEFRVETRLTPSQNILLVGIDPAKKDAINAILSEYGVEVEDQATVVRRASMACPAMPTCGLALAESERYLPDLLDGVEGLLKDAGLEGEEVIVRMTGCPNGCARPYMAELGLVGRSPGKYHVFLGGNESSTRIAKLFFENVKAEEMADTLRPAIERFKAERNEGERFGDFAARVLIPEKEAAAA